MASQEPEAGCSGALTLKVWDRQRRVKKGLLASSFTELVEKGVATLPSPAGFVFLPCGKSNSPADEAVPCSNKCLVSARKKFNINANDHAITFVLESDGTEVDDEYFSALSPNTILILLKDNENWTHERSACSSTETADMNVDKTEDPKLLAIMNCLKRKKNGGQKKPLTRRLQVGWSHFDVQQKRYVQVRSQQGGGSPWITVPAKACYEEVVQQLSDIYFVNGKSTKGKLKKMAVAIGTINGRFASKEDFSLEDYLLNNNRIYLLTRLKNPVLDILDLKTGESSSSSSSSSSSGDESLPSLPSLSPPSKRNKTSTEKMNTPVQVGSQPLAVFTSPQFPSNEHNIPVNQVTAVPAVLTSTTGTPTTQQQQTNFIPAGTPTVNFRISPVERICDICRERQKDSYFFPCGHTVCMICGLQVQGYGQNCPTCRGRIERVQSLFE